jgi:hypothetical protein
MGKTEWARSLGRHLYFGEQWSQEACEDSDNVEYAVFDDCKLTYVVNWKGWLGQQKEFITTDKYKGKKGVKWGKPSIWCCNGDPRDTQGLTSEDVEWLNGNCTFIEVTEKLY